MGLPLGPCTQEGQDGALLGVGGVLPGAADEDVPTKLLKDLFWKEFLVS